MTGADVFNLGIQEQTPKLNANVATGRAKSGNTNAAATFSSMVHGTYTVSTKTDANVQTKTAESKNAQESYSRLGHKEHTIASAVIDDKLKESSQKLDALDRTIVEKVAQTLNMDEDTVRNAMEELGLSAFALMNPQDLAQLTVLLTDVSQPEELLLQPEFVDLMNQMQELQNELMDQLGLTPDEMQDLLTQMDVLEKPEAVTDNAFAQTLEQTASEEGITTTETAEPTDPQTDTDSVVPAEGTGQNASGDYADDFAQTADEHDAQTDVGSQNKKGFETERTEVHMTEQTPEAAMVTEQSFEEVIAQPESSAATQIDPMDLIEQFAQQVKVSVSEGFSSMEMQLNPENLGKVYLQVSSREGEIRAQIAASDEAVKNALETQVAELRETLHQAGLKVDSIEVTVASHQFERNLEQGQNREFEEGKKQQEQQSQRRNIQLSSLDELSSLMTEEEALAAQIMKDNGNSVDLTA